MYLSDDPQLISGGIAGGISDGNPIVFRCIFKPTATNRKTLVALGLGVEEFRSLEDNSKFKIQNSKLPLGRHDACVAVRAVPIVEAMAALVLQDLLSK